MTPEPVPLAPPKTPPAWVRMVTTAGATLLTAVMTALDSSMRTSLTLSVLSPWFDATGAADDEGSRRRFVTPTAERPPERMPATMAMAMIGTAPRPRRVVGAAGGSVAGWLDQAGAPSQVGRAGSL